MTTPPVPPQPPGYPPQPGYPPPSGYPQRPPIPPKSGGTGKVILIVLAVIIGLCGFGGLLVAVSGGGDKDSKPDSKAPAVSVVPAPDGQADVGESPEAGQGSAVRDGKFEFVVTGVESGVKVLGDNPYLQKEAQGSFIIVTMTVKNIGDKPQSFFASNQYLFDDQGRKFGNDSMAAINLEPDTSILTDINPGNMATAKVVFDVPADAVPSHLVLHDSAFSGGVKVALK